MINFVNFLNSACGTTIVPDRQSPTQSQNSNTFRNSIKKKIIISQLNQHRSFKAAENHRDWFHENVGKNKKFKYGINLIQEPYLIRNKLGLFDGLEIFQHQGNERVRA